ncbi:MAG: hypothetical protein IPJ65_35700 [Archangiaceae bacterium]|nr:hypothetical protein [Archangiaceae bacterium]
MLQWAADWHALGALTFPSAAYNAALQKLTDRFSGKGAAPARPNGSAISQIRSNEIALAGPWELREFHLNATGHLVESTVANTPDASFTNSPTLGSFVNANQAALIAGTAVVPQLFNGAPFRAAATFNNIDFWAAPGIVNNAARFGLSVNTCNGCHGRETNTGFLQVNPRAKGQAATLSGFLTGIDVVDPVVPSTSHHFADLSRRATDLASLACSTTGAFEADTARVH